jgi:site-specific DNA-methyltransferase (adenine-specific)
MARKPLAEKTVAENCLKYGTGGINIDESRVGTEVRENPQYGGGGDLLAISKGGEQKWDGTKETVSGRFPANLIHDNSEEVRECFPETKSGWTDKDKQKSNSMFLGEMDYTGTHYADNSGNASRFFKSIIYQAKASKSERNKGCEGLEEQQYSHDGREKEIENPYQRNKSIATNNHPTVKPVALMEYLIKMVTPVGGIVLDPFAGSGTTGVAARNLNRNFILIEKEQEYIAIINKRLLAQLKKI